jgi:c-di-GMP-binding flagellar brake protein YcgR
LPLKGQKISVEAVVLKIHQPSEAENLSGLYEYRTQFICSDKQVQETLNQFVFEKQREMLMKRKMQQEFLEPGGKSRKTSSR